MQEVILALLQLFRERAPDPETNACVTTLATHRNNWPARMTCLAGFVGDAR